VRRLIIPVILVALVSVAVPALAQEPVPEHVHLVVGAANADCHTGSHEASPGEGGSAELKACVYGSDEAPATTSGPYSLTWQVAGAATLSSEPRESNEMGVALTTATLDGAESAQVTVWLCAADVCDENSFLDSSTVGVHSLHGDPVCAFNGTNCDGIVLRKSGAGRYLAAIGQWPEECMAHRPMLVKKRRDGRDPVVRFLQSDAGGEAYFEPPRRWHGRYYNVVPRWQVERDDSMIECPRRKSGPVFIR